MQMATFKTIICKVVAECPVNLGGIIFVHFIAYFEATLSGSVAKEFRFGLIRARTILKLIILFLVLSYSYCPFVQPNLAAGLMMTSRRVYPSSH